VLYEPSARQFQVSMERPVVDPGASDARGSDDADLCAPFLQQLPVTGVAVSMFGGTSAETLVSASDELAARLDALQFDLGEGPRWEALRTRLPVLIPDVHSHPYSWPVFNKALLETNVAAMFVFPLTLGAMDLGAVELHHTRPGSLSYQDHITAAVLTGRTAWHLLRRILSANSPETDPAEHNELMSRREIHQATGMVLAQAGTNAGEALLLLRAHAFANGIPLREAADAVLRGHLRFAPENDGPGNAALQ
jgi:GAF domain-containing protein